MRRITYPKCHILVAAAAAVLAAVQALAETRVEFYSPRVARIIKTPDGKNVEHPFKTVIAEKTADSFKTAELEVKVDESTGAVTFLDKSGNVLLEEAGGARYTPYEANGVKYVKSAQKWKLDKDEAIYGFGDNQWREMNLRWFNGELMPRNVGDGLAVWTSVKGYGVLWDNTSPVKARSDDEGVEFESTVGEYVDYYFSAGGSIDDVVADWRMLTGDVPMFPRWAYGFWQSKERYESQHETVGVLKKYREYGIPLDGIVQDWQYWGNNYLWNAMEFLSPDFRDPKRFLREVHGMNAKMAITIWQSFGPATKQYAELKEKGLLFPFETWPSSGLGHIWPPRRDYMSGVRLYDAYSAEARDIYWNNLTRLFDLGVDCWWMDSTDPDHMYKEGDFEHITSLGVPWRTMRSAYPVACTQAVYDHMRKATDKRVFIFTRGAGIGQQRNAAAVWSGDTGSSWDTLRKQVTGGLNFVVTGNPHFNCDLGGFFASKYNRGGGVKNPNWHELYVRWIQLGTFLPMMRSHGTQLPREFYLYGKAGESVYDALVGAVKLRYRLMPYFYTVGSATTLERKSFMRPLAAGFPHDKATWDCRTEFLVGDYLLAAPVLAARYTNEDNKPVGEMEGWDLGVDASGQVSGTKGNGIDWNAEKTWSVYLPEGADWYCFESGKKLAGGKTVEIPITLASQPFFLRAGTILPLGPDVQYNGEKQWDNLEIRVYPGADGEFCLYEDDFETYAYEKGEWTKIPFKWCDKTSTLTIGKRVGAYPGMLEKRTFNIVLPCGATKHIAYDGEEVKIEFATNP